jgi:hypothetical protein
MIMKNWISRILPKGFTRESKFLSGEQPLQVFISSVMNDELAWARKATIIYLQHIDLPSFQPWAFESTPASSENVQEGYLRKVRESDFIVWLIGSTTTEPVKKEIREAISADIRILAFKFHVETRDEETLGLLQEVGLRAKWCDVDDKPGFVNALEGSLRDEIIRALRGKPGLGRIARYKEMLDLSRARCLARWQAAGIPLEMAVSFYNDSSIGIPPSGLIQKPVSILIGSFGSGKSLIAERIYQIEISKAIQDSSYPIPVYIRAQEITDSLEEKVLGLSTGLGNPKHQGALIIIDGADEAGISTAYKLLDMARVISSAWPKTSVLITSRPMALFTSVEENFYVQNMSIIEVAAIASKVSGQEVNPNQVQYLPKSISDSITKPLFALIWGNYLRQNVELLPKTIGELISYLVESSVKLSDLEVAKSNELLERLAVFSIDRGGSYIHRGEIGLRENVDQLLASRLVEAKEDFIGFPLPILSQWFAAQSLAKANPEINSIINDPIRLDRWRYPLIILASIYSYDQVTKILAPIVEANPGFASEIVDEAIAGFGQTDESVLPPPRECAEQVRMAVKTWISGMGNLANATAPISEDGRLHTIGVNALDKRLMIAWYRGQKKLGDIVELPAGSFWADHGWYIARSGYIGNQPGWAWRWSLEEMVRGLDDLIKRRGLVVRGGFIYYEKMWQIALNLMGYGDLHQDPILIADLEERLGQILKRYDDEIHTEWHELADTLKTIKAGNKTQMEFPWPTPDNELPGGGWIWDAYSDQQILNRAIKVYSASIQEYERIVDTFLVKFKPRLITAALLPAKLIGKIHFSESSFGGRTPGMNSYFDPLAEGSISSVQITLGDDRELINLDNLYEKLRRMRPLAAEWIYASSGMTVLDDIFFTNPVTRIVYDWLEDDLKRIKWIK